MGREGRCVGREGRGGRGGVWGGRVYMLDVCGEGGCACLRCVHNLFNFNNDCIPHVLVCC